MMMDDDDDDDDGDDDLHDRNDLSAFSCRDCDLSTTLNYQHVEHVRGYTNISSTMAVIAIAVATVIVFLLIL